MTDFQFYRGDGQQQQSQNQVPTANRNDKNSSAGYRASKGLAAAVDVALRLGMPLLITGEPGTGKSCLAYSLAWERNLGEPLRFVVKSDTQAKDLFYHFDTVGRFHAANMSKTSGQEIDARRFLNFSALGKAILYTHQSEPLKTSLGPAFNALAHPGSPRQSVVLIDEIDKAPRDVPNDLLWELENNEFEITEIANVNSDPDGLDSSTDQKYCFSLNSQRSELRPLIIITSNSEKSLPDAFLRRCVYYHLPFPDFEQDIDNSIEQEDHVTVQTIVSSRLSRRYKDGGENLVEDALSFFRFLREQHLSRRPGLSELLNWLDYLLPPAGPGEDSVPGLESMPAEKRLLSIKITLLKDRKDYEDIEHHIDAWLVENRSRS